MKHRKQMYPSPGSEAPFLRFSPTAPTGPHSSEEYVKNDTNYRLGTPIISMSHTNIAKKVMPINRVILTHQKPPEQSGDWHASAPLTGAAPNHPRPNALPVPGLRKTKPFGVIHSLHIPERGKSTPVFLGSDEEKTRREPDVWRPKMRDSGGYSNDQARPRARGGCLPVNQGEPMN